MILFDIKIASIYEIKRADHSFIFLTWVNWQIYNHKNIQIKCKILMFYFWYILLWESSPLKEGSVKTMVRFKAFKNFTIMFSDTVLFIALLIRWLFQNLGYWDSNDKINRSLLTCLMYFLCKHNNRKKGS